MQVLGAYGFRGQLQRKTHFLKSIKLAMISPTKKPPAPSSTAYTGMSGQMMPSPIIATPTAIESSSKMPEED